MSCSKCTIHKNSFSSASDYQKFSKTLSDSVMNGDLIKIQDDQFNGPYFKIHYACTHCGANWTLSVPDQAFRGGGGDIMKTNGTLIDIVIPYGVNEASMSSLKLCEIFIGAMLTSSFGVVDVAVDRGAKSITCRDQKIRETIRLILGAGKLDAFASQLISLLHPSSDTKALGELKCISAGQVKRFLFFKNGDSAIDWQIVSQE